jgi:hypothetical protein
VQVFSGPRIGYMKVLIHAAYYTVSEASRRKQSKPGSFPEKRTILVAERHFPSRAGGRRTPAQKVFPFLAQSFFRKNEKKEK